MISADEAVASQPHRVERMSSSVVAAYEGLGENLELLAAIAGMNLDRFEHLPPDDFFAQKTSGLCEPLQLFLEDYEDGSDVSLHFAVPISTVDRKRSLLPWAASAAGLLFQLGHFRVGIAVVDSTGPGFVFQYRSREDVVCREVTDLRLAGGVL